MSFESRFGPGLPMINSSLNLVGGGAALTQNGANLITSPKDATNVTSASGYNFNGNTSISIGANSLGTNSGYIATSAQSNIGIGAGTLGLLTSGTFNIAIGPVFSSGTTTNAAGASLTYGSSNILLGLSAGSNLTSGGSNVAIGSQAFDGSATTSANGCVAIGYQAFSSSTLSGNNYSIGIGYQAGAQSSGANSLIAIGYSAGSYCSTNNQCIFIGSSAGTSSSSGVSGAHNIAIGTSAMSGFNASYPLSGPENIAIGLYACGGMGGSSQYNTIIGSYAGANWGAQSGINSSNNVAIGRHALYSFCQAGSGGATNGSNTTVGFSGLGALTTGTYNTTLGNQVGSTTLTTGAYNLLLGCTSSTTTPASSTSNYLALGLALDGTTGENSNTANAGIRSLGYVAEKNYQIVNAATATVSNASSSVIITGQATCTITTPAAPVDGQLLKVSCDGTAVSTFSLTANTGQTVRASPASLAADIGIGYIYRLSNTTWYRQF
jgi:hypothetical protein